MSENEYLIHPAGIIEPGARIGKGSRIWAFAHILSGAVIGEDCNVCDSVFIENDVIVGNRVTIKCGVQLWDGVRLEDDIFIGPNVTFTNDPFPRSKHYQDKVMVTVVKKGASIGANATILPGITIGQNAMIGAGSVVTHNVPPNSIVVGNPARIQGYANSLKHETSNKILEQNESTDLNVSGVKVIEIPLVKDIRGNLTSAEIEKNLPFLPKRYFVIDNVPSKEIRGEHAHKNLHQFLVCLQGSVSVMVEDGTNRADIILDRSTKGLYIPPLIWGTQYHYSPDAILFVLASDIYNPDDYIREYDDFRKIRNLIP